MKNKTKVGLLILIVMLLALPVIIYLVRQTQTLKSRAVGEASSVEAFDLTTSQPIADNGATPNQNIRIKLTYADAASSPSPSVVGLTTCTISGPPSFNTSTGATYSVQNSITCGSAQSYSAPGGCLWFLRAGSQPIIIPADAYPHKNNVTITAADNVIPGAYLLWFQKLSPTLTTTGVASIESICYKDVTVTGSGSSTSISGSIAGTVRVNYYGSYVLQYGATVYLCRNADAQNCNAVLTASSNQQGNYSFTNVPAGNYYFNVTIPSFVGGTGNPCSFQAPYAQPYISDAQYANSLATVDLYVNCNN